MRLATREGALMANQTRRIDVAMPLEKREPQGSRLGAGNKEAHLACAESVYCAKDLTRLPGCNHGGTARERSKTDQGWTPGDRHVSG